MTALRLAPRTPHGCVALRTPVLCTALSRADCAAVATVALAGIRDEVKARRLRGKEAAARVRPRRQRRRRHPQGGTSAGGQEGSASQTRAGRTEQQAGRREEGAGDEKGRGKGDQTEVAEQSRIPAAGGNRDRVTHSDFGLVPSWDMPRVETGAARSSAW